MNVALPHIQQALGFSGTGLEWVVNAYAVTFGGLLPGVASSLLNTAQQSAAAIGLLALVIGIATIRVGRQDLPGAAPAPQQAGPAPREEAPQAAAVEQYEDRAAFAAAAVPAGSVSRKGE